MTEQKRKICIYIDGYNLYHAIKKLNNDRLKWLDLKTLMNNFIDPNNDDVMGIYYFSAYATWNNEWHQRHKLYVKALEDSGVHIIMGNFKNKKRYCDSCGYVGIGKEEKETDVNIAIKLLDDAYQNKFDKAILVSQDSDLLPSIKLTKQRFPNKIIKIITPPNLRHSKNMAKVVGKKNLGMIDKIHIERSRFSESLTLLNGEKLICPEKYKIK